MLSSWLANLICVGFTVLYIIGFYLFKTPGDRNDPPVIRARMKAVTVASIGSLCIVWLFSQDKSRVLQVVGLRMPTFVELVKAIVNPVLLTSLLFLGPLSVLYFDQELPFQKYFYFKESFDMLFNTLLGQRNYIVAPVTEEFVFRACMIAILYQAGYSKNYLIFVSPLYFGIAHLHHAWDNYVKLGKTRQAFQNAMLSSLFQFLYTTVFGWYASFLFIRFGQVIAPIIAHSFCNILGFPDLSGIQDNKSTIKRTIMYSCFPIGILLFILNINCLTSASGGLIQ